MLNVEKESVRNMGKCYFLSKRNFCVVKKQDNVCPNKLFTCQFYINTKPELFISEFKLILAQLGKDSIPIQLKGLLLKYFR